MSRPSLFAEPKQTENADKKFLKRIDELIDESEIEAMAEIDKQIRYKNAKFALIALIAIALAALLYLGVENQSLPGLPGMDQTAKVEPQPAPGPETAPIGDPTVPADQMKETPAPETTAKEKTAPTLNEVENQAVTAISEALNTLDESPSATDPVNEMPQEKAPVKEKPVVKQAKAEVKSNGLPVNPPAGDYFVQVGAFSVKSNADRMLKKLKGAGLPTNVSQIESMSSMHTLLIGGFSSPDSAQFLMKELKSKGHTPDLIPAQDGNYAIMLDKTRSLKQAEAIKEKLAEQGIFTQIEKRSVSTPIHVIRVGGFASKDLAARYQKEIAKLGYPKTLVRKITQ
ncbi:SPOR domain-containing protein [Nitrospina gracilis]|uniref:SPOR domain-containing protein n=1 Tax=Nitrospina gracilis TaxID=35801 RepID=UPI001F016051|nr:SPOR domain-containing protein [Nitrospina gracilis]MCF8720462.1 cell division septation protein DedD [Nitrospina gracilis Nb-211]